MIEFTGVLLDPGISTDEPGTTYTDAILEAIRKAEGKLEISINSYGGSVDGANVLASALHEWCAENGAENCVVTIQALALSCAANFVAFLPNGAILKVHPSSMMMFHSCSGLAAGGPTAVRSVAAQMDAVNQNVIAAIVNKTGLPAADVATWFLEGNEHWLCADDIIRLFHATMADTDFIAPPQLNPYQGMKMAASLMHYLQPITRGVKAMDEDKKELIEGEEKPEVKEEVTEEVKEEVTEEIKEDVPENDLEKRLAELEKALDALKAENQELRKCKPTALKMQKAAPAETFPELVAKIPANLTVNEYSRRFNALKAEHKAEYDAYLAAHASR